MSGSEHAETAAATLDILLGTSWKVDARCLARLYTYEKGEDRFDFTPIVDIIDIVVEGTNITSRLPEESIFCVMHELTVMAASQIINIGVLKDGIEPGSDMVIVM